MRNGVFLLEFRQGESWSYLGKLLILFEQLRHLGLMGHLVDLVRTVELLHIVHHA